MTTQIDLKRQKVRNQIKEIIYTNQDWLDKEELAILSDCLNFLTLT